MLRAAFTIRDVAMTLSIAALAVSLVAVFFARVSARAGARSAAAAVASDHRVRTPNLAILHDDPTPAPGDRVIYRVRNDGPQDLEELVVYRPRPPDRIKYPIAVTGGDWADDEVGLGPLALTQEVRFTLCCGSAQDPPDFRVRIMCRAGDDEWEFGALLPNPRGPSVLM